MKNSINNSLTIQSWLGFAGMLAVSFANFFLALRYFTSATISTGAMYNAGVDVLGAFVCAMLYFGCMGDNLDSGDEGTKWFRCLIFFTSLSFLNNEVLWYLTGSETYGRYCLLLYSITKWFDFTLVLFFYLYIRATLELKDSSLARWLDKAISLLLIPMAALILVNLFVPVCFSVDEFGVFKKESFYWLIDLYLMVVAPLTTFLLLQSDASRKQKTVAFSFIFIPIVHYIATGGVQGYATQYGSVLISLILMYCILFGERSRKLASTQTELKTATLIQEAMLPNIFPAYPDRPEFDLYASMDAAKAVGGDFYDFFLIDDDHLCIVIADVSGKGVPAALFMMVSKVILQSCAMLGQSSADILNKANEAICSNNETNMFVTVWVGILEISTGTITAANAGHEYPVIMKNGEFSVLKDRHGFVIGGMEGVVYKDYEIKLEPGDKLFLYTDGVPESTDKDLKMFGMDRMLDVLNDNRKASSTEILGKMRNAIDEFVNGADRFDDITMLCIGYNGPDAAH